MRVEDAKSVYGCLVLGKVDPRNYGKATSR